MPTDNAFVRYVSAETGQEIAVEAFYDPGLDRESDYWKALYKVRRKFEPRLVYDCGWPK